MVHTTPAKRVPDAQDEVISTRLDVEGCVQWSVFNVIVAPQDPVIAAIYGEGGKREPLRLAASVGQVQPTDIDRRVANIHDFHPICISTCFIGDKTVVQCHEFVDAEWHIRRAADPSLSWRTWIRGLGAIAVGGGGVPTDLVGTWQMELEAKSAVQGLSIAAEAVVEHGQGLVGSTVHADMKLHRQRLASGLGFDAQGVVDHGGVHPRLDVSRELGVGCLAVSGSGALVDIRRDALGYMPTPSGGQAVEEGLVVKAIIVGPVRIVEGSFAHEVTKGVSMGQPCRA